MLRLLLGLALTGSLMAAPPEPPKPNEVVVVYNSTLPQSKKLAENYAKARALPQDHLIGLSLPNSEVINRDQFNAQIRRPLEAEFDKRRWWTRKRDLKGNLQATAIDIKVICCMRGVPSRIKHSRPKPPEGEKLPPITQEEQMATKSAAVDSELALLGVSTHALSGPLQNPYFRKDVSIRDARIPILLVGRIDAHSWSICERMIQDAITAEKEGLWGFGVVDIANKLPQGDLWLEGVASALISKGIPTLVDRSKDTLPLNFPLRDTAVYYGWYDWHVNGPFKNPKFRFKRGAVAVHLHSFSAAQLRNPSQNWCAPFLAKGAAATLGNTFEPFLHLTHHFDIFQRRLLDGYTLVEAAYMANPAVSWQGVVLGDPLYRPYLRLDGSGRRAADDKIYRALRISKLRWPTDDLERDDQLLAAYERMNEPSFLEAIGLDLMARKETAMAASTFTKAKTAYTEPTDKLRMNMLIAMIDREAGRKASAIRILRDSKMLYASMPETKAAEAWLKILDPPPPPPTQPQKGKKK